MDKLSFAEALGKKIITSQQNRFEAGNDLEDISHITNIKRIILAISDYLKSEDVPQDGINAMVDSLKQLSIPEYLNTTTRLDLIIISSPV